MHLPTCKLTPMFVSVLGLTCKRHTTSSLSHRVMLAAKGKRLFSVSQYSKTVQKMPSSRFPIPGSYDRSEKASRSNAVWYTLSGLVVMLGATYAAVPLFKIFCESQGIEVSQQFKDMTAEALTRKLASVTKVSDRCIEVKFDATSSADLQWKFEPVQEAISVIPGETALAFFKAKNMTDRSIVGVVSCLLKRMALF